MSDPDLTLALVANRGTLLVALVTKYLSTLPHPIEILEDQVSCISVTSSLLQTLNSTILKYHPTSTLCPKTSFINLLCKDILIAFNYFGKKVQEAKALRVFEPNDVGLVRVPSNAWAFILGGEAKVKELRDRLSVEKYRVRVLIEAVAWSGLKAMEGRSVDQERELEGLRRMSPLIAERLLGVWKDYRLRLGGGPVEETPAPRVEEVLEDKKEPVIVVKEISDDSDLKKEVKFALHDSPSTSSIASSTSTTSTASTVTDDSIQERWVLRHSTATRVLQGSTKILGITLKKTYRHTAGYYYIKPLPSHPSEIEDFMKQQARDKSPSPQTSILALPDKAQKEIQILLEARRNACSNDSVKRSFQVIGFSARPRRDITPLNVASKKWTFGNEKKNVPMEWVLVLKGETIDCLKRTTPVKREDAWNPKPKEEEKVQVQVQEKPAGNTQQQVAAPVINNNGIQHVLRHVEVRRGMSLNEAEKKIEEICKGLIRFENGDIKVGQDGKEPKVGSEDGKVEEVIIQKQ